MNTGWFSRTPPTTEQVRIKISSKFQLEKTPHRHACGPSLNIQYISWCWLSFSCIAKSACNYFLRNFQATGDRATSCVRGERSRQTHWSVDYDVVGCCYEGERPLSIVTFEGRQFLLLWRTWNDVDRHRPFFLLSVNGINQTMLQRPAGLLSWVANASNRGNLKFPKCLSRLPRPLLRVTFVTYVVCSYYREYAGVTGIRGKEISAHVRCAMNLEVSLHDD